MKRVSIERELGAYFELVEIGTRLFVSGLMEAGLSRKRAKKEAARLQKERFMRGDAPGLVARAWKAGIWRA